MSDEQPRIPRVRLPRLPGMADPHFLERMKTMSESKLRFAISSNQVPSWDREKAEEHLSELVEQRELEAAGVDAALREREIIASETSAHAAVRSARWALLAMVVSVVALFLAAIPYFSR